MVAFSGFYESHEPPPSVDARYSTAASRWPSKRQQSGYIMHHCWVDCRPGGRLGITEWVVARWRRFMAFIKATKRHHRTSARSDNTQLDTLTPVVSDISSWKRAPVDMLAPYNNWGMTYQTNEKHLTIFPENFVGVVALAHYLYFTCFQWCVITNNLLKYL